MLGWFTGRQKSNLPEPTALQAQRNRQIEQLKSFNQNVSEIQRDVEYRVNTNIAGTTLSLYITLPPLFPQDKPVVKVSPQASHPWINDHMIVTGSPSINSFAIHSDLGKVISEVVNEFHRHPPNMQPYGYGYGNYQGTSGSGPGVHPPTLPASGASFRQTAPYPTYIPTSTQNYMPLPPAPAPPTLMPAVNANTIAPSSSSPAFSGSSSSSSISSHGHIYNASGGNLPGGSLYPSTEQTPVSLPPVGSYHMPAVPTGFPQLMDFSLEELQDLRDNEDSILQILGSMTELQKINIDKDNLIEKNEQVANENLLLKPVIEERKRCLLDKYDQLNEIRRQFDENSYRQDAFRQQFEPSAIQQKLRAASTMAEEESDGISEQFLEGQMTVDEFKKRYMEKRKLYHTRKAKEERLVQCVLKQGPGRPF